MAMEINSTSVNVTWSIPTVTNGVIVNYMVYYAVEDNGVFLNELTVEVEAIQGASMQSIVLHNLTEFTSYRISVTASTNIGEGNRSTSASVTTDPDSASPPSFVDVMVINSTAILITWGYPVTPSGIIQGYIIQYGAANGNLMLDPDTILTLFNHTLVPVNDMTNQSVAIESLKPFTHYVFEVAAYAFSDDGDPFRIHEGVFSPPTAAVQTGQAGKLVCESHFSIHSCDECTHTHTNTHHTHTHTQLHQPLQTFNSNLLPTPPLSCLLRGPLQFLLMELSTTTQYLVQC